MNQRTFFKSSLKKMNQVEDSDQNNMIGYPNYKSNGYGKFPFMKIECNDYGLDISDVIYFESDETVNICKYI